MAATHLYSNMDSDTEHIVSQGMTISSLIHKVSNENVKSNDVFLKVPILKRLDVDPNDSINITIKAGSLSGIGDSDLLIKAFIIDPTAIDISSTKSLAINVDTELISDILLLNIESEVP